MWHFVEHRSVSIFSFPWTGMLYIVQVGLELVTQWPHLQEFQEACTLPHLALSLSPTNAKPTVLCVLCVVTMGPALSETKEFPLMREFWCRNWESPGSNMMSGLCEGCTEAKAMVSLGPVASPRIARPWFSFSRQRRQGCGGFS